MSPTEEMSSNASSQLHSQSENTSKDQQRRTDRKEGTVPVEEKLYLAKYKLDERPHLVIVDQEVCQKCSSINSTPQPCMILCPANVYKWEDDMKNVVSYDNCVECGACRIICPYGNIEWKYPRWGRGLSLRYG